MFSENLPNNDSIVYLQMHHFTCLAEFQSLLLLGNWLISYIHSTISSWTILVQVRHLEFNSWLQTFLLYFDWFDLYLIFSLTYLSQKCLLITGLCWLQCYSCFQFKISQNSEQKSIRLDRYTCNNFIIHLYVCIHVHIFTWLYQIFCMIDVYLNYIW